MTTFAGPVGGGNNYGSTDGTGTAAKFWAKPMGITNDGTNLYVVRMQH